MPLDKKKGTVNHTGRIKILRDNIQIRLVWTNKDPIIIKETFKLNLPDAIMPNSQILLDVRSRTNYICFDLGKKDNFNLPDDPILTNMGYNSITFTVRVVNPDIPGLLSAKSADIRINPPKRTKSKSNSEKSLLGFQIRDLEKGVPMRLEFPPLDSLSQPIFIQINKQECGILFETLEAKEPAYEALILPANITCIAERLVSDTLRGIFDIEEELTLTSSWHCLWNYHFGTWTGKSLGEVDYHDGEEVSKWIDSILSAWSLKSGNPAKVIYRHMGGVSQ